jgi:uncharacterized membrane protein
MKLPIEHERLNKTIDRASKGLNSLLLEIRNYFLTGILVLIPLAVTLYTMYLVFQITDGFLGSAISKNIGYRIPGVGLIMTALLCVVFGIIAQNYVGRRILEGIEKWLERIPVVRSLYHGIKQVSDVVVKKNRGEFKRVVMVEYPKEHSWTFGFVTGDFVAPIKSHNFREKQMATVYVPTTPNPTSGFLLIIEKSRIVDTDMDIEEAMKIVISGGLVQPGKPEMPVENKIAEELRIPQ